MAQQTFDIKASSSDSWNNRDVHHQHLAEPYQVPALLHSPLTQARTIVDYVADAILVVDADGLIQSSNPAGEMIFDCAKEAMIGHPFVELLPVRYRSLYTSGVRLFLDTGEAHLLGRPLELAGLRNDGSEIPLELIVTPAPGSKAPEFVTILRDMSERQQVEVERAALLVAEQEQSRRLRELAALKADFTAMVAHELAQPLSAIRALTAMVATGKLTSKAQSQALATIQDQVDMLVALVADVRTSAQVERDDFTPRLRPVSVADLLAAATAFARALPGEHSLEITAPPAVQVHADPVRIGQVLRNLLNNAATYSLDGTPIALCAYQDGARVRFEVIDHGHGIHHDDLARVFEKFGRGRDSSASNSAGMGLGLYLSRRIVQAHGSDLVVSPSMDAGSIFAFELEVSE